MSACLESDHTNDNTINNTTNLSDRNSGPLRTVLSQYSQSEFFGLNRCFSSSWYTKYEWLEYSVEKDAIYCFPCRQFSNSMKESMFSETGMRNWKKLPEKGSY